MPKFGNYSPTLGGHAPGDLREAFLVAFERIFYARERSTVVAVDVRSESLSFAALCGLLWNCSDVLPGSVADAINLDIGRLRSRTYASAARLLKRKWA